jgi:hypothetical protein
MGLVSWSPQNMVDRRTKFEIVGDHFFERLPALIEDEIASVVPQDEQFQKDLRRELGRDWPPKVLWEGRKDGEVERYEKLYDRRRPAAVGPSIAIFIHGRERL